MQVIETKYSLRLFESPKKDLASFVTAIGLYAQHTPPHERTPSNEITYWFERYNTDFDDRLLLFGFYRNDAMIGFAELGWFREERLIVLDYMTIHEQYRRNNTFFEFLEQIKSFLDLSSYEFDFIATEIPYSSHDMNPPESSRLWIQLLRIHGFGLVHAPYQLPQLGQHNLESAVPGALMIYTRQALRPIKKETYLLIVDTIYFKYYVRWYRPFLGNRITKYEANLRKARSSLGSSIVANHVDVNGTATALPTTVIPARKQSDLKTFVLPSLAITTAYMIVLVLLGFVFHLSVPVVGLFVLFSLLAFFSILAVVSKRAMQVLDRILRLIRKTYGTEK